MLRIPQYLQVKLRIKDRYFLHALLIYFTQAITSFSYSCILYLYHKVFYILYISQSRADFYYSFNNVVNNEYFQRINY